MSSVLFDVPGPRARLRYRILTVVGIAVLLGALAYVIYRFYDTGQFTARKWSWAEYRVQQEALFNGLLNTLRAFAVGAVLAMLFGAVFAAARLSDHVFWRGPSTVVVEFFRAVPLLIMMFFFYYGLPTIGIKMSPFMAVVLGLTLYNGSVLAEVFRAGINSLPKGQSEAAYALGMRKTQVMVLVLLPQALRAMLPTIISQLVVLLKDTALGFIITYEELLDWARDLGGQLLFGRPYVPVIIVASAIYIGLCLLLSWFATYLEKRNRRSKKVLPIDTGDAGNVVAGSAMGQV
ncbi:amino acid ABC transporter permease [Lentzea tibetensis]|uniref:Amino acid ABC transporter permease n=1 Tax=Lentzea tibetensis TaxID=2591470 RepID=A0A563EPQ2_9PSEU|nr:amino acid ABC transporter permease [Lentzea tibetensis]TWP49124.1 amino acid ABC transporter permease [Lentzea tibetensis]